MAAALELVKELAGDFRVRQRPRQSGGARDTAASIERARHELGYDPEWDLRKGLTEQIEWHANRDRALRTVSFGGAETR
jgi:nucleoside-diphosphate-sugar epimerase